MPFGVAIVGAAAIGAAGSVASGMIGAQAAGSAGAYQRAGAAAGQAILGDQLNQLSAMYNPYVNAGVGATQQLQSLLYSPQQLETVIAQQESQLMAQRPIKQRTPQGRHMEYAWQAAKADYNNKYRAWQQRYDAFQKQANLLRDQVKTNAEGMTQQITQSPLYQYQSKLTDMALAKQGLLGSQEAIKQQGALTAQTYGQIINQLTNLSQSGLNATQAYGNQAMQLTGNIANFQAGQQQAQAQGTLGQANAYQNMIGGVTNSINGAVSAGLNYSMFNQMMGNLNNTGVTRTPAQQANVQGAFNGLGMSGGLGMT